MTTPNYYLTFREDTFTRVGRLTNPIEEYMFMKWTSMKYRDRIGLKPDVDPTTDLKKIINIRDKMEDLEEKIVIHINQYFDVDPNDFLDFLHTTVSLQSVYGYLANNHKITHND